jgi:chemotaxis receptor (MCP) glutamine deamidase CheD
MAGFQARLNALEGQYAHEEQRLALTKHLERLVRCGAGLYSGINGSCLCCCKSDRVNRRAGLLHLQHWQSRGDKLCLR